MINIIEVLEKYAAEEPDTPILYDETFTKGLTYSRLEHMTGCVYAYLKDKGIGKEDFVLINLPRGVLPVVAMVGVWKAGAAWALVEDTYAPDRIDYIRKDCGCKIELNASVWDDVMNTDSLKGHETTGEHDAAYAIYTSGTTGNPKGVLHEYGNLSRAIESIRVKGVNPFKSDDRLALLAPLNFVASVIVILEALSIKGGRTYIVSYATIKNPGALKMFFFTKKISITFLTPSYVRMLGNSTGPYLRMLFVGSEPANNLYNPNLELINIYAASESGFAIGVFKIDKAYETCPIGKPEIDTEIILLSEDGQRAPAGEMGELTFHNPYVRGYINLPEETRKAFSSDGFYRTGDLARCDENGNYILLGRSGDMIKINGNRIEPAEIEAAVKQALGISWAAAKGFSENGKSYLCAYYTEDVKFDPNELRTQLQKRLPYYMIPAYFIKIEKAPLKANGKLDRKALPAPDTKDFVTDYVAPTTETQMKLCQAFQTVLKLQQVGIHDDFYEMGGDSLAAIQAIVESQLPGLNASEIFRGRTPERIAEIYEQNHANDDGESPEIKNARAMKLEHPLTTEQLYMVDYQLYTPKSTMCNLFTMLKFSKDQFDLQKLVAALRTVIKNHPALMTTFFFNEDGEVMQKYTPEVFQDIRIEKISDWELDSIKDTLVQPFKIIGGALYRCRVFETEKAGYVFFDVHHTVFDGTSFKVFMGNVGKTYMGLAPDPDFYYLMLQKREEAVDSPFYAESREYFENKYDGDDWSCHPTVDFDSRENEIGKIARGLDISQDALASIEKSFRISRNEFFITAAGLAISLYNDAPNVKISWIFNGREDTTLMTTCGLLFRELPVGFRFKDDTNVIDIYADVHEQVQKDIEHSCYPYVEMFAQQGSLETAMATLLYQRDIRDVGDLGGFQIEAVDVRQNKAASENILDMQVLDGENGLSLAFDYTASHYRAESMDKFQGLFKQVAEALAQHAGQAGVTIGELKKELGYGKKGGLFGGLKKLFGKK